MSDLQKTREASIKVEMQALSAFIDFNPETILTAPKSMLLTQDNKFIRVTNRTLLEYNYYAHTPWASHYFNMDYYLDTYSWLQDHSLSDPKEMINEFHSDFHLETGKVCLFIEKISTDVHFDLKRIMGKWESLDEDLKQTIAANSSITSSISRAINNLYQEIYNLIQFANLNLFFIEKMIHIYETCLYVKKQNKLNNPIKLEPCVAEIKNLITNNLKQLQDDCVQSFSLIYGYKSDSLAQSELAFSGGTDNETQGGLLILVSKHYIYRINSL